MRRWFAGCVAAALTVSAVAGSVQAGPVAENASPASAAAKAAAPAVVTDSGSAFVQQGLTIHELDKELARLKSEEVRLDDSIAALSGDIERQRALLEVRSESAGRVLRSYYMGHRDQLWMLLFRVRSLNEALLVLDYLQAIVTNDFRTLRMYKEAYEERQALLAEQTARQERLQRVIAEHETQRVRMLAEQAELDRRLAELAEEERNAQLAAIAAAASAWEESGIPLFEQVLTALSEAMTDLPALLADPSLLVVDGASMEVRLTDQAFNNFLQQRNPIFETFRFVFEPEGLTVSGSVGGTTATLSGVYLLENEPANALRFQISSVRFNGFELPDTTRTAMQEQYDLAFEPGRLVSGLTVSELLNEEGVLRVKLSFSFGGLLS